MGTMYAIHNTVRGRHNRTQRAASPVHHRLSQRVGTMQARLIRNRPLLLSEADLLKNLDEIKMKQKLGVLEVRTTDGRMVNLDTMAAAPVSPSVPLPNPPLDSAANDKPAGQAMPTFVGGKPIESLPEVSPEEEALPAEMDSGLPLSIPKEYLEEEVPAEVPVAPVPEVESPQNERRGGKGKRR